MKGKGFTLIELVVVLAVLGVLMAVVIVAINPRKQVEEATEKKAMSNVRQVATAMETCIARSLAAGGNGEADCDTSAELLTSGTYGTATTIPSGVTVSSGCVSAAEAGNLYCKYTTATGEVVCNQDLGC